MVVASLLLYSYGFYFVAVGFFFAIDLMSISLDGVALYEMKKQAHDILNLQCISHWISKLCLFYYRCIG
jgi:hypothetical protein